MRSPWSPRSPSPSLILLTPTPNPTPPFNQVSFAFVPPVCFGGGWPAFVVSLSFIAIMTVIVGDLAGLFGCVCGLDPGITAITFVALGTSMPDLFASKAAATA